MKQGWVLIEVMTATAIGALLASSLFVALYNGIQVQKRIDNRTSEYIRLATFKQRFEQDIAGIFAPLLPASEEKEGEKKNTQTQQRTPVKKVFYATEKNKQIDLVTFITNNPVRIYEEAKNIKPKPRAARVVYRLEPDGKRTGAYKLTRQEGTVLEYQPYTEAATAPPRYTIIDGIKSLSMDYIAIIDEKTEERKEVPEEKLVTLKKWADPKKESDKKGPTLPLAPNYIEVTAVLWDEQYKQSRTFEFTVQRFSDLKPPTEIKKEKPKDDFESFKERLQKQIKEKEQASQKAVPGQPIGGAAR